MGYAKPRKGYYEAHYATGSGNYEVVRDTAGKPIRFATKRLAEQEADHREVALRRGETSVPTPGSPPLALSQSGANNPRNILFHDWAELWYTEQDLAPATMANYKSRLQSHLLPEFGGTSLNEITKASIAQWVSKLRRAKYAPDTIEQYRALLHLVLGDAVAAQRISDNPARRPRNRGRRVYADRGQEKRKVLAQGITALLIAERMALLSGRDDEFVLMILANYTGLRLGELTGLETQFVQADTPTERTKTRHTLRVEWQLSEVEGTFYKDPPKENSRRDIDLPDFLWLLLVEHIDRTQPAVCPCHNGTYVFSGQKKGCGTRRKGGPTLNDVARSAGVNRHTASIALRGGKPIAESTRARILTAAQAIGYVPVALDTVWHQRRAGLYRWIFTPAVSGQIPREGRRPEHPVWIRDADVQFPGVPVRGPRAEQRATGAWEPLAQGMTPHGNRHSHRTDMEELGIPPVLIDDRIGHLDRSVQRRYTHPTDAMRDHLVAALTQRWLDTLDARLEIWPTSPVRVLNTLLKARATELAEKLAA